MIGLEYYIMNLDNKCNPDSEIQYRTLIISATLNHSAREIL